jgi:hypothetical protein
VNFVHEDQFDNQIFYHSVQKICVSLIQLTTKK